MGLFGFLGKKTTMPAAPGGIETGGIATRAPLPPTTVETQGPMPPSIAPTLETKPLNVGPSILPIGANTASTEAWHAAKLESMGTPSTAATTEPVASEASAPSAAEVTPTPPVIEAASPSTVFAEAIVPLTPPVAEDEGDNPSKNAPPASEPQGEEAERSDAPTQPKPDARPAVVEAPATVGIPSLPDIGGAVEKSPVSAMGAYLTFAWENQGNPGAVAEFDAAWEAQGVDIAPAQVAAEPQPDILANIGHMESPTASQAAVPATPIVGGMEQSGTPSLQTVMSEAEKAAQQAPSMIHVEANAAASGMPAVDAAPAAVQTETSAAPESVAA